MGNGFSDRDAINQKKNKTSSVSNPLRALLAALPAGSMRVYISQEKLGHYPDLFLLNKIRLSLELVVLLQIRLKQKILSKWHLERADSGR